MIPKKNPRNHFAGFGKMVELERKKLNKKGKFPNIFCMTY